MSTFFGQQKFLLSFSFNVKFASCGCSVATTNIGIDPKINMKFLTRGVQAPPPFFLPAPFPGYVYMSFETIPSFKGREMKQRGRPDENAAKKGKREELKKKEMKEKEIKVSKKKEKAEKKSKGASKKAKTKKSERLVIVETSPGQLLSVLQIAKT